MVRVLGVDPGTFSFDLCGLDNGTVAYEQVIPTPQVANNPETLIQACEAAGRLDLITGPSGYGVQLISLSNIDDPEDFTIAALLLSRKDEIDKPYVRGELGIMVYRAMATAVKKMKEKAMPVYFIPSVILLPTVPAHRKFNKIDMGTADKMCIAVLGVHDQSREHGVDYSEVSFILVEMGFGYNAVIGVHGGRIVDGIGGTVGGMGFLTIGGMDAELVQLVGSWERSDVFYGGARDITGKQTPEDIVRNLYTEEACRLGWEAMIEDIEKEVAAMTIPVPKAREILISGRLTRVAEVKETLFHRLSKYGHVREIGRLEGASNVKEAAQGYAIVADGLAGGRFSDLIEWMKIKEAKGTTVDYLFHPRAKKLRAMLSPWF